MIGSFKISSVIGTQSKSNLVYVLMRTQRSVLKTCFILFQGGAMGSKYVWSPCKAKKLVIDNE